MNTRTMSDLMDRESWKEFFNGLDEVTIRYYIAVGLVIVPTGCYNSPMDFDYQTKTFYCPDNHRYSDCENGPYHISELIDYNKLAKFIKENN